MNATPGPEPPGPGPGTLTGERRAGPYVLELGDAAGTKLSFTTAEDRRQAREIVSALGTKEAEVQEVAAPIDRVDYALEEAEEVTGKVERAAGLLAAIAEGRIDPKSVSEELDALLDLVERLDREGRFKDALRLARALSALLALLGRWVALVDTLRTALRAARAISDLDGEAWALHELGTLALAAGNTKAAIKQLERARALREQLGDRAGLATTDQNLDRAGRSPAGVEQIGGRPRLRGRMALGAVSAIFAALGLAAGWAVGSAGNNERTTTVTTSRGAAKPTSTATVTVTNTVTSRTTETTTVFTTPPSPG